MPAPEFNEQTKQDDASILAALLQIPKHRRMDGLAIAVRVATDNSSGVFT